MKRSRQEDVENDKKNNDDDDDDGDDKDSYSLDSEEDQERKKKKDKRRKKKHRRRDDDDRNPDKRREHGRSHEGHDRKDDKKRDRRRHRHRHASLDQSDSDSSNDVPHKGRKKEEKKSHREKRRRHKDSKRKSRDKIDQSSMTSPPAPGREDVVAEALCHLLNEKPDLASELPLILIRLAGGAAFDLRQMNDSVAALGLHQVFESLSSFGVRQNDKNLWMFQPPASGGRHDELILLRVIRALLNDVGVTMDAILEYESNAAERVKQTNQEGIEKFDHDKATASHKEAAEDTDLVALHDVTCELLDEFSTKDPQLAQGIAEICKSIAEGESVSIDGIPDVSLRQKLETIFVMCGLEKSEIVEDDESDSDSKSSEVPTMGFGLPDEEGHDAQVKLAAIMKACRNPPAQKKPRVGPVFGPMREGKMHGSTLPQSTSYGAAESDDEGPAPAGSTKRVARGPALPMELVKEQAEERELQLKATTHGVAMPAKEGEREEWMIVPGKYDFLSAIKSGQSIRSRQFQNKKARHGEDVPRPVHPAIQAEMDAIMQAHEKARGPSLVEQHRAKKRQEKEAAIGDKAEWKWNRENDLDAGRRVDKDALHMILGGASENLKTKFQGGFR